MKEGDVIPGIIGWHYHGDLARELPGIEVLASSLPHNDGAKTEPHAATLYDGPKGNVVFSAGSTWWVQGLSSPPGHVLPVYSYAKDANKLQGPDPRVQRMMANVFDRFVK